MCPSAASLIPVGDREIALQLQALLEFSDFIEQRKPGPGLHNQNGWRPGPRPAKPYTLSSAVDIQVNSVIKIVRAGGRHRILRMPEGWTGGKAPSLRAVLRKPFQSLSPHHPCAHRANENCGAAVDASAHS